MYIYIYTYIHCTLSLSHMEQEASVLDRWRTSLCEPQIHYIYIEMNVLVCTPPTKKKKNIITISVRLNFPILREIVTTLGYDLMQ